MIVQPKFRGFICTTSHPLGCALHVEEQINYVSQQGVIVCPKNILIIGASTGYGLASRIAATFGGGANTIGVFFERPASGRRTATAGWYNTSAFERAAHKQGLYAKSINGDAFSNEVKQTTIDLIKADLGQVDMIIYSLASPRRVDPVTGETYTSVLKPIGESFTGKTVDFHTGEISNITLESASEEEITDTTKVMGGEDWQLWIEALNEAGVLANDCLTLAYSYIGPEVTHAIYRDGTIGRAKSHLEQTATKLNQLLAHLNGKAHIAVNKAVVTQSSAAIPVVPLYVSLLFKIMEAQDLHEGCIEQMYRMFSEKLKDGRVITDEQGRIRLDDWEMRKSVQAEIIAKWEQITTANIEELCDLAKFRSDFFNLFGFGYAKIDYDADVDVEVTIPSIAMSE